MDPTTKRREGNSFKISQEEINQFNNNGYLMLENVLTEAEMLFIDHWFDHFTSGKESHKMGKDFCDMSQPYGIPMEDFQLVNAMLPSQYRQELANNIFHIISQNIADQLYSGGIAKMDYEQFLAKKPSKEEAEFAMHQDLGYWPKTKNTWTATFSLALTDADIENGCLYVIPGSNKEESLRAHKPKAYKEGSKDGREDSHTLVIERRPEDTLIHLPVKRGSVTIHDERIVHGSGGNHSDSWRKTYIAAYRDEKTIEYERSIGFTHSHNDNVDWEKIVGYH